MNLYEAGSILETMTQKPRVALRMPERNPNLAQLAVEEGFNHTLVF